VEEHSSLEVVVDLPHLSFLALVEAEVVDLHYLSFLETVEEVVVVVDLHYLTFLEMVEEVVVARRLLSSLEVLVV
jgi:hypothetical protein